MWDLGMVLIKSSRVHEPNNKTMRRAFWEELRALNDKWNRPWVIGGDFNVVRFQHEWKGGDCNIRDKERFNSLIGELQLIDIPAMNRVFTWSNMRDKYCLTKLDGTLVWYISLPTIGSSIPFTNCIFSAKTNIRSSPCVLINRHKEK